MPGIRDIKITLRREQVKAILKDYYGFRDKELTIEIEDFYVKMFIDLAINDLLETFGIEEGE